MCYRHTLCWHNLWNDGYIPTATQTFTLWHQSLYWQTSLCVKGPCVCPSPQATNGFFTDRLSCNVCTCGISHTLGTECHTSCAAWGAWQGVVYENCRASVRICMCVYLCVCVRSTVLLTTALKWLGGERAIAAGKTGVQMCELQAAEVWRGGGAARRSLPLPLLPTQTPLSNQFCSTSLYQFPICQRPIHLATSKTLLYAVCKTAAQWLLFYFYMLLFTPTSVSTDGFMCLFVFFVTFYCRVNCSDSKRRKVVVKLKMIISSRKKKNLLSGWTPCGLMLFS